MGVVSPRVCGDEKQAASRSPGRTLGNVVNALLSSLFSLPFLHEIDCFVCPGSSTPACVGLIPVIHSLSPSFRLAAVLTPRHSSLLTISR